jgi:hypothetical protein
MRLARWTLGVLIGLLAIGTWLWTTIPAAAVLAFAVALAWAIRERLRLIGLGGLLVGAGAGLVGLVVLIEVSCDAANAHVGYYEELVCASPEVAPHVASALLLVAGGAALTITALRSARIPWSGRTPSAPAPRSGPSGP